MVFSLQLGLKPPCSLTLFQGFSGLKMWQFTSWRFLVSVEATWEVGSGLLSDT